jgi:hypothetical protein
MSFNALFHICLKEEIFLFFLFSIADMVEVRYIKDFVGESEGGTSREYPLVQFLKDASCCLESDKTLEFFLDYSNERSIPKIALSDEDKISSVKTYNISDIKQALESKKGSSLQVYNPEGKTLDTLAGFKIKDNGITIEARLKPFNHPSLDSAIRRIEVKLKDDSSSDKLDKYCSLFERLGYKRADGE